LNTTVFSLNVSLRVFCRFTTNKIKEDSKTVFNVICLKIALFIRHRFSSDERLGGSSSGMRGKSLKISSSL